MTDRGRVPTRYESIKTHMPEIDKFVSALQEGVFEAYETLGVSLASLLDQPHQSDIFMAIIFGLMSEPAQLAMLADPRINESETVPVAQLAGR
jgi:hypothetical protein